MSYDCVTATTYSTAYITFTIPWEHELSELKILCFVLDEDNYQYTIVDSGTLTTPYSDESTYRLECPFTFSSTATTTKWAVYVYRHTTTTVDDPSYDGSTIPIEALISKLEEHGEKLEEAVVESLRAVRVPETDSNAFYPPAEVRAGRVAGFDDDGNPTVGSENIAELAEYTAELDDRVAEAKGYAEQAAASAEEAEDSADAAERYADQADTAASNAQAYSESMSSAATDAISQLNSATSALQGYQDAAAQSATDAATSAAEALNYSELGKIYLQAMYGNLQIVVYSSYDDLPSPGSPTEFYFVGNDDDGYTEYLWVDDDDYEAGGYYLKIGSSDFSALQPATTTQYGLVRLSTDEVLEDGDCAAVGVNTAGQLMIPAANRTYTTDGSTAENIRGTVRLGSAFHPVNSGEFIVGIGTAKSDGGLAFDLYPGDEDEDGNITNAGALRYKNLGRDADGNNTYNMRIMDATSGQLGAVKLISSLDEWNEDTIATNYPLSEPYAAHIQVVVQGIRNWAESWTAENLNETKIQEYFANWAAEDGTLEQMVGIITADENYLASFTNAFAANTTFMNSVYVQVASSSVDWWEQIFSSDDPENDDNLSDAQQSVYGEIMAKISAEANDYFEEETYREYVDAMLSAYLNGDTESEYYPSAATDTFVVLIGDGVSDYFEDEANLATFIAKTLATNTSYAYDGSTTLTGTVESVIMQVAKKLVQEYWDGLMNGTETVTIDGEATTIEGYLASLEDSATSAALEVCRWYKNGNFTLTQLSLTRVGTGDPFTGYTTKANFGTYDGYLFCMYSYGGDTDYDHFYSFYTSKSNAASNTTTSLRYTTSSPTHCYKYYLSYEDIAVGFDACDEGYFFLSHHIQRSGQTSDHNKRLDISCIRDSDLLAWWCKEYLYVYRLYGVKITT